jgi:hypothetical protein
MAMFHATEAERLVQNLFEAEKEPTPDPTIETLVFYLYDELEQSKRYEVRRAIRASRNLKTLFEGVRTFSKNHGLRNAAEHMARFNDHLDMMRRMTAKKIEERLRK